jgi:hypothetical protein
MSSSTLMDAKMTSFVVIKFNRLLITNRSFLNLYLLSSFHIVELPSVCVLGRRSSLQEPDYK